MNAVMACGLPEPLLNESYSLVASPVKASPGASFVSLVHSRMLFVAGYDRKLRCLSRCIEGENLCPHMVKG